jgi:hypothetical protein
MLSSLYVYIDERLYVYIWGETESISVVYAHVRSTLVLRGCARRCEDPLLHASQVWDAVSFLFDRCLRSFISLVLVILSLTNL